MEDNSRPFRSPHVPYSGRYSYSRAELWADGIVHAVGIVLAITAGAALLALSFGHAGTGEYAAAVFYVISLLTVLSVSCAYNLWPLSPVKWALRRFDHAAIYLLIAGTYTPFLAQLNMPTALLMCLVVWAAAGLGMAVKLVLPGRYDRLAVVFYLAIGWSGVAVAGEIGRVLPASTVWLIVAGGIVYSFGVIFFIWQKLRFQSALWHGFVISGAACHMAAMMDLLVIARP
ncbi:PAQR family membrane homeostasis protein TrhA [Mesorhizobium xinjiangense]|uniref:PAQR family membrane homeostasis protein TrhA n=1 Tax=Mesorhizobium xinjiangense TaxID=2678685 RepID=UPI0012EE5AEE|nr:hemolysin III family protein [Mesorhizobium xinjiangense]